MAKIYAQMYSLREENEIDFKQSLKNIADLGFDGVEFAGYYGIEAHELKAYMDEVGLETLSAHVGFDLLREKLEEEIQSLKILGAKYIVCPHTKSEDLASAKEYGEILSGIAEACDKAGMPLLYHNHSHELQLDGGQYPLEVLFEEAPKMLQQPDLFWVTYAGVDAVRYVEEHKKRIKTIHLKQMDDLESKKNIGIEGGIIDMKKVMEIAPDAYYIYEQEFADEDILQTMRQSIKVLKSY